MTVSLIRRLKQPSKKTGALLSLFSSRMEATTRCTPSSSFSIAPSSLSLGFQSQKGACSFSTQWEEDYVDNDLSRYDNNMEQKTTPVMSLLSKEEMNRTSLLMELTDRVGALHDVLRFFWKYDVNITRIESRPSKLGKFDFFVDLVGQTSDTNVSLLLEALKQSKELEKLLILDKKEGKFCFEKSVILLICITHTNLQP